MHLVNLQPEIVHVVDVANERTKGVNVLLTRLIEMPLVTISIDESRAHPLVRKERKQHTSHVCFFGGMSPSFALILRGVHTCRQDSILGQAKPCHQRVVSVRPIHAATPGPQHGLPALPTAHPEHAVRAVALTQPGLEHVAHQFPSVRSVHHGPARTPRAI